MSPNDKHHRKGYLFNVDILIEEESNALALEALLHQLNQLKLKDYRIRSGIEIGRVIDATLAVNKINPAKETNFIQEKTLPNPAPATKSKRTSEDTESPPAQKGMPEDNKQILDMLQIYKQNNTLVRLSVLKGKGVKLSIPCKILNYDESDGNLSVYHVDEKKVYLFKLYEIDDFSA